MMRALRDITLTDYLDIGNAAYEWAQSYDTKDWERLKKCLAPSVHLDFRNLQGELYERVTPAEFAHILASPGVLGDEQLRTQHFLGAGKWETMGHDTVRVSYQIRAAHQRYSDESLRKVVNKGHAYGVTQLWFRKIGEVWKINGVVPGLDWSEYDLHGTLGHPLEKHP